MKEAFAINPTGDNVTVSVADKPIPTPDESQVLIRVVSAALNPKDWKVLSMVKDPSNQGDDIAGYVHSVGGKVTEFKPGDRVAAFHQIMTPHGGYAEYALAWASTTFHIPKETSFEGLILGGMPHPNLRMQTCLLSLQKRRPSPLQA